MRKVTLVTALLVGMIVPFSVFAADWDTRVRVGGQTSTFVDGEVDADGNLFSQNFFFLELSLAVPEMIGKDVTGDFVLRLDRQNVEGSAGPSDNLQEAVRDASVVEAYASLIYTIFPHGCDKCPCGRPTSFLKNLVPGQGTNLYARGSAGFMYTDEARLEDQDTLREFFLGVGWMLADKNSIFRGSLAEVGWGYSERFQEHNRYKGTVEVQYNSDSELKPFVSFKWNLGRGPDDLAVYYGVGINPKTLFDNVSKILTPKSDTEKAAARAVPAAPGGQGTEEKIIRPTP